jgi:hypothetical protein
VRHYIKFFCYGIINYGLFVRIIYGHRGGGRGVEVGVEMSHLKFLRREELRWLRRGVFIVGVYLFLIQGLGIVRRLVHWPVRGSGSGRIIGSIEGGIQGIGKTIMRIM